MTDLTEKKLIFTEPNTTTPLRNNSAWTASSSHDDEEEGEEEEEKEEEEEEQRRKTTLTILRHYVPRDSTKCFLCIIICNSHRNTMEQAVIP